MHKWKLFLLLSSCLLLNASETEYLEQKQSAEEPASIHEDLTSKPERSYLAPFDKTEQVSDEKIEGTYAQPISPKGQLKGEEQFGGDPYKKEYGNKPAPRYEVR